MVLNEVDDAKQVRLLIEALCLKALKLKRRLKKSVTEWTFVELKEVAVAEYSESLNKYAAQVHLYNRIQESGESAGDHRQHCRLWLQLKWRMQH